MATEVPGLCRVSRRTGNAAKNRREIRFLSFPYVFNHAGSFLGRTGATARGDQDKVGVFVPYRQRSRYTGVFGNEKWGHT
jgi:hypothetical protein